MSFLKLILSFSPWIALLVIARDGLFRLKVEVGGCLFFKCGHGHYPIAPGHYFMGWLVFLYIRHIGSGGVRQHVDCKIHGCNGFRGTGRASTWLTIVLNKPFTLDYAREHTDPSLWNSPSFIRTNIVLTSVWGLAFTVNAILAWGKMEHFILSELNYEITSYTLLIGTVAFTNWYPNHVRRRSHALGVG